jgi:hypothetical protein
MSAGSNQSPSQQSAGVPDPGVGTLQGPSPLEAQVPDPGVGTLQGPSPLEAQVPDPGVGTLQSPTQQPAATIDDFSLTVATLPPIVTAQEVSTIGGQATTVVQSFPATKPRKDRPQTPTRTTQNGHRTSQTPRPMRWPWSRLQPCRTLLPSRRGTSIPEPVCVVRKDSCRWR